MTELGPGVRVICVARDGGWFDLYERRHGGPAYGEVCTIVSVEAIQGEDYLAFREFAKVLMFDARYFRPRDPDISALRALLEDVKAREPVDAA